ncbi:MAG: helix-turn-helix domain-containing protein [Tannerella sp.]|jgi:AraC-like DNA-binding protein/heme exporter protein D|nr:helix-turn-helix domain-containing protein [Tannerella sp.]
MKQFYILSILFLLPVFVSAQNSVQQQKDSLRKVLSQQEGEEKLKTYQQLANRYYAASVSDSLAMDTLFTLYNELDAEAGRQQRPSYQVTVRTNILSVLQNRGMFDEIIARAPATLEFMAKHKEWKSWYQSSRTLAEAYRRKGEYEQALREAQAMYDHAKERQDAGGMGTAFYTMGRIYSSQRRFAEQEKCLRECIRLLQDSTAYLNILANACTGLGFNLVAQERYDDALLVAAECEDVTRRYEEASKSPQASSWMNVWMVYLDAGRQSGDFDKAEFYLHKIDSATNGSMKMYEERAHILKGRKRYADALEMINKAIASSNAAYKIQVKGEKLDIFIRLCEADSAALLFREIIADMDARNNREFTVQLDDIRTQYEVEKHIAEKQRNRSYFLFALGGCFLLLILLGTGIYHNRIITGKNRGLYRQIKEQDRLREELEQMTKRYENLLQSVPPPADFEAEAVKERPADRRQNELVERLNRYLLDDKNFMKPDIDLDGLALELATNRSSLFEAVKTITGKTPMEYIHTLQLNEARQMLNIHPDLTVEAIAADCGFNNRQTFYRLFKEQYDISPAEYRKMVKNR